MMQQCHCNSRITAPSRGRFRPVGTVGIEQTVQMDDEIAHLGIVDGALRGVDNAEMRYFIVHLHRLLDPDGADGPKSAP